MPSSLINKYAQETKKPVAEVEKIWDEAKEAAGKKFKPGSQYWAYVNGTVRKRLGLSEALTFKEFIELDFSTPANVAADITNTPSGSAVQSVPQAQEVPVEEGFARYIGCLFAARDTAHILHLATNSYASHVALNELYDLLLSHADKMAESYQGKHGLVALDIPAARDIFGQGDAKSFVYALSGWLESCARALIGDDSFIINSFEDFVGSVYQIKYKLDNLK